MLRHCWVHALALSLTLPLAARAEVPEATVKSLSAPDSAETSIGTLKFKDGVPDADTGVEGLRRDGLRQRARRVQQQLPGRLGVRDPCGPAGRYWGKGQRCHHLFGTDGRELVVPDRQRGHGLLHVGHRPHGWPDGDRAAI